MKIDGIVISCLMQWAKTYSPKAPVSLEISEEKDGRIYCKMFSGSKLLHETRVH